MPNSALLSPPDPEDLGAWERDIFLSCSLLHWTLRVNSFCVCVLDDLHSSLSPEPAGPWQLTIFSLSQNPSPFVLFVWISLACDTEWKAEHSRCHRCQSMPLCRPRRHQLSRISPLLSHKSLPALQHLSEGDISGKLAINSHEQRWVLIAAV